MRDTQVLRQECAKNLSKGVSKDDESYGERYPNHALITRQSRDNHARTVGKCDRCRGGGDRGKAEKKTDCGGGIFAYDCFFSYLCSVKDVEP